MYKLKELYPEEYKILRNKWASMITRCTNHKCKNYMNYGGRGISICEEWRKFRNFFEWSINNGYKVGLSIDRINTNKNYSPDNCRYITMDEQQKNKRNNRCFVDPFDGEQLCLAAIAKKYNIDEDTFRKRVDKYKMPLEIALTKQNGENARWRMVVDPIDGERLCLTDLARKYNLSPLTLRSRVDKGWSLDKAIVQPRTKRTARKNVTI